MNIAVILAGGIGSRVGADIPKQFIEVLGKPVLAYTIEAFQNHAEIDAIEVVCVDTHIDYLKNMIKEYKLDKVKWVVEGGGTFQESLMKGIYNLENICSDKDTVVVHCGASPFVKKNIITDSIRVSNKKGNAISTTPFYVLAGIKEDNEKSNSWIDRDSIACMNSPHSFNYKFIKEMYDEAIKTGAIDNVEPHTTNLMYEMEKTIYFSKGSQTNIKITKEEDLDLFEGYLLMKQKYQREKEN